jgi:D-alanine-D-alanine ligase
MGVLPGVNEEPEAIPITEIISDNEFFDYSAKYEGESKEITPADLSSEIARSMQEIGKRAYKLLGCKGMVRIDFILIDSVTPAILEINSVPGFSKMSILPQQLESAGISICDALTRVLKSVN